MGGKSNAGKESERVQVETMREQNSIFKDLIAASKERTGQMDSMMKPSIDFYTSLASGDMTKINAANSVPISGITRSFDSAKNNIMDSVAPGAARQFTLANLERDKANQLAVLPQQSYYGGLDALAKIGTGMGNFALQQTGAGMRAGEASTATAGAIQQQEAQKKATQMGFIGQLAGAGGFMTGNMMKR